MKTQEKSSTAEICNVGKQTWSDLPCELLQEIGDRLPLVELLSFRGVCKDWRSASSTASAECEYTIKKKPWFLLYDDSSNCRLHSPSSGKVYTIHIPELDGATCIASKEGWLLMSRDESLFFLCPFSRAKIDLPEFPYSDLSDHIAMFSSPPTSPDCVVCVVNQSDENKVEINTLHRGSNEWVKHTEVYAMGTISLATFTDGSFYFLDSKDKVLAFSNKVRKCSRYTIVGPSKEKDLPTLPFGNKRDYYSTKMQRRLGLEKVESLSTCGTAMPSTDGYEVYIHNENIKPQDEKEQSSYKGVWIYPRFFQLLPNQSW